MKSDRFCVFCGNKCVNTAISLIEKHPFQNGKKLCPNATALGFGCQINRILRAPAVGSAGKGRTAVSVAQNFPAFFIYEPWKLYGQITEALQKFRFCRYVVFKGVGCG